MIECPRKNCNFICVSQVDFQGHLAWHKGLKPKIAEWRRTKSGNGWIKSADADVKLVQRIKDETEVFVGGYKHILIADGELIYRFNP